MSKMPSKEQVQVNFRMPEELRDRIKAAAEANNRSMNAEIVARLNASFVTINAELNGDISDEALREVVHALRKAGFRLDVGKKD